MLLSFLVCFANVNSQPIPNDLRLAYQKTFELKLKDSNSLIKSSNSNHPIKLLIDDYNDVLNLIIDEDLSSFDELENQMNDRLDLLDEISDKKSPWYRLVKAEIKFHWGLVNFKFNNQLSAAWQINQAHSLIKENQKKFPDFKPNLKSLGIFHIVIGAMPDNYQWIMERLGFKGDINLGIKELQECVNTKNIFQQEAKIILAYIKAHLLNKYNETTITFEKEYEKTNYLSYNYLLVSLNTNSHNSNKAIQLILNKPIHKSYPDFHFYHYKLGNCYFQKGEYLKAINELNIFTNKYKGKNYVKGAYHKIALSYYFLNDDEKRNIAFKAINDNGWDLLDEDKYAQRFYNQKVWPNKDLAKARYYTDGGYFEKALITLRNRSYKTIEEQAELNYRLARIYDLKGDYVKALLFYYKPLTIGNDNTAKMYITPNSYLKAAIIHINNGDTIDAKLMLQKAIDCKNHQYENSIEMKAKGLLKTIED